MKKLKDYDIREEVRKSYTRIAKSEDPDCGCSPTSCCGNSDEAAAKLSLLLGYSMEDIESIPEGSNLGLGCGNPRIIASLQPGETVLDLGSGAGFDCFLAARAVGPDGYVIGVDMTPDMIRKARNNADKSGLENVEFRLGEIENLPVADNAVDVIISNCVINLSPEKEKVFKEAYRVLKKGGRLAISDIVATAKLPEEISDNMELYSACISGASTIDELEKILKGTGFKHIEITPKDESREFLGKWNPGVRIEDYIVSANIQAVK